MAKKFKDYYDAECAIKIAEKISVVYSDFDKISFVAFLKKELPNKEFLQRQDVFVTAFERFLTKSYTKNIKIFSKILGPELKTTSGMFVHGWWLWPVGRYVEKNALLDFDSSINFIYELTKRFTGEFAIRNLLRKYPKKSLKIILKWTKDKNPHVRRLASEGIRPRLPWAPKLDLFLEEFDLYKKILTNLKNDKEKFVQKSVANNLNDLMKINSKMANSIITDWQKLEISKSTQWIIKHGTRSLRR